MPQRTVNGIRWISVEPGSGYGNSSASFLSGMASLDVQVNWTPLVWWKSADDSLQFTPLSSSPYSATQFGDPVLQPIDHEVVVVHWSPIWFDQLEQEAMGKRLVAFTMWETDRLPEEEVATLNRYDQIIVPSAFNRDVFVNSGVTRPIAVVPLIARPIQSGTQLPYEKELQGKFVFYFIGTWTTRKAISDLVAAFAGSFSKADDVALVIHTTAENLIARERNKSEPWSPVQRDETTWFSLAKELAGYSDAPKVVLYSGLTNQGAIDALHVRGDCFVSLSRGEGWGLGEFEAATAGNSVVLTAWGSRSEMLPADYPYFVDCDIVPTTDEEPDAWWRPQENEHWAKANVTHATSIMRHVFENQSEAKTWGDTLQLQMLDRFNSRRVTEAFLAAIDEFDPQSSERSTTLEK